MHDLHDSMRLFVIFSAFSRLVMRSVHFYIFPRLV